MLLSVPLLSLLYVELNVFGAVSSTEFWYLGASSSVIRDNFRFNISRVIGILNGFKFFMNVN